MPNDGQALKQPPEIQCGKLGVVDFVGVGDVVARGLIDFEGDDNLRLEPWPVANDIKAQGTPVAGAGFDIPLLFP